MITNDSTLKTSKKEVLSGLGAVSALGLYFSLLYITINAGVNYAAVFNGIAQLVTGNVALINNNGESMLQMILVIVSVVLITLPIAAIAGMLTSSGAKSYDFEEIDKLLDNGPFALFSIVAIEEILTRGLFLGLLTKVFTGDFGFYAMFLIGNALWAFVHMYNFKDVKEQSILRVVPQFIGGIAFTYLYVRYGLLASIMAHYLYNTILMAMRKEKMPSAGTFFAFIYYIVLLVVTWFMMVNRGIGIPDLLIWVTEAVVPLSGYNFWDYAIVLLGFDAIVGIIAVVLFLDTTDGKREALDKMSEDGLFTFVLSALIIALLNAAMILLMNWLLGFFIGSIIVRSIVITIILAMTTKSSSGSSLARATLVNLPDSFFTVAAFLVLGLWAAMGLSLVFLLVHYLPNYVNSD